MKISRGRVGVMGGPSVSLLSGLWWVVWLLLSCPAMAESPNREYRLLAYAGNRVRLEQSDERGYDL